MLNYSLVIWPFTKKGKTNLIFCIKKLITLLAITSSPLLYAAPGDVLFSDDFESGLANWSITSNGGNAQISTATANSGNNSLFTRWQKVAVTSNPIDISFVEQVELTAWIRRGDDNFSEEPDQDENLLVEYLDNTNNWTPIAIYQGDGTAGEQINMNFRLPSSANHANFQVRFRQTDGSGIDWDYWHIDDVAITEVALTSFSCDDFEGGLDNWTISSNGGSAGISSATFNSSNNSLFTRWGEVEVTSTSIDTSLFQAVEIKVWVQRGDDSFSEYPDNNEDLVISYLDNNNNWNILETFVGNATEGEIFDRTYSLPSSAIHSDFRLRIVQTDGSGSDWDYWHIDDVCIQDSQTSVSGLIGEWRFDELFWNGSNDEVLDSSGNGLHLTAFNAITTSSLPAIPGDPGTCSYGIFNGSVSFIQLNDDTSTNDSLLDIPNNLTVTAWINTNVIPSSGLKSILSKDENYEFHINSSGQIYWWWNWGTLTTTGASLTIGDWHHIAITWRSGEQVIYINGIERARSARTGILQTNNDPLQVGQDLDIASRFFDGSIDEIRIYENFLNASEINQIMSETRPCTNNSICSQTIEDNFNAVSYNNSTGSQPWNSNWIEQDDDNLSNSGNVLISGGQLNMDDRPNSGGEPSIAREFDISNFLSSSLRFDLATSGNLENGDRFDISVSSDGGANYTILETFTNDFIGTYNYDLTPYASANTRVRFRIENGYGNSNEFINIDNLVITGILNCGPDHFVIIHDGSGINCLREAITIQARNADGSITTDYTGTINLSLSTNNGNWFITDNNGLSADLAQGTLSDVAGDNNGIASYQFDAADLGNVVLYLENTVAEATNIAVSEAAIFDDNSEGDITFRAFGFTFSPSPITTQIAGRPFNITLTAAGQTPTQTECGVIEEYAGDKSINFWSAYTSPISSPTQVNINSTNIAVNEASSSPQTVNFTNGIATVSAQYNDVGQISIQAKDEIDIGDPPSGNINEIIGGISPFIVRPFGFDIQIASDPFANDGNGIVFSSAGANFNMTLRSVLWESADDVDDNGVPDPFIDTDNNAEPDSGGNLGNNGITPNISQIAGTINLTPTALVVTNSNGILSNSTIAFSDFESSGLSGEGTFTLSQSWDEVGILQINGLNIDFMSGGENVIGERINIGRFIPDHFSLSAPVIANQCGTFTYGGFFDGINAGLDKSGQPFIVSGTITAQNSANQTTQNYQGAFAKLVTTNISSQGYNIDSASNASGRVNFLSASLSFNNGVSNYSDPDADYQFDALVAPFNLRLDLTAVDSDAVTSGLVSSNSIEVRNGRLRLIDAYGPETSDLEMPIASDYFAGTQWLINNQDNCTAYIDTHISLDAASYTLQLNAGETSVYAPVASQLLSSGVNSASNGFWFSASGANNFGSVDVNFDLTTQPWLMFDWDEDDNLDNPSAQLNFGYYRGSDRVIYWKEVRN